MSKKGKPDSKLPSKEKHPKLYAVVKKAKFRSLEERYLWNNGYTKSIFRTSS